MHIDDNGNKVKNQSRRRVLLRTSFREGGKVRKKTVANITHCPEEEIEAIKIALRYKKDLPALKQIADGHHENGKMVGAVEAILQVANQLGITKALGNSKQAKMTIWMVMARLLNQGSRLSAVRLAGSHAGCEILGIDSLNEDDLYDALDWLCENRENIQKRLFGELRNRKPAKEKNSTYLYDVSSSYLEGDKNELAAWGYNRDKKSGKKQIVFGLLTDEDGEPLSIEAFTGNTRDPKTVESQVARLKESFGCEYITLVGDKGMIRSPQQLKLTDEGCHYITSITKPEIRKLINAGTLQMELFDLDICEVIDRNNGVRYILRRNPDRARDIRDNRKAKLEKLRELLEEANLYLDKHPRARVETQLKQLAAKIEKLKTGKFVDVEIVESRLRLKTDDEKMENESLLDGCYVIKTDLPGDTVADEIHERYKDLAKVELGFRTMKTGHLEVRPVYLRNEERTRAHLFVTMLAYKIERYFRKCWDELDYTVADGLEKLKSICGNVLVFGNHKIICLPRLNEACKVLTEKIGVVMPEVLPFCEVKVVTRKTLKKMAEPQKK